MHILSKILGFCLSIIAMLLKTIGFALSCLDTYVGEGKISEEQQKKAADAFDNLDRWTARNAHLLTLGLILFFAFVGLCL